MKESRFPVLLFLFLLIFLATGVGIIAIVDHKRQKAEIPKPYFFKDSIKQPKIQELVRVIGYDSCDCAVFLLPNGKHHTIEGDYCTTQTKWYHYTDQELDDIYEYEYQRRIE